MRNHLARRSWAAAFTGLALLAFVAGGCGDEAQVTSGPETFGDEAPELAIDLTAEDGGMTIADESPGFGDEYFARYLGEDEPAADPLERDPSLEQLEQDGASIQYLRVTWGNLRRGPEAADVVGSDPAIDWAGLARITDGVLMPRQLIAFERGDYLVRPDSADGGRRQTVKWVSYTTVAWDGILFKIVVPPAGDTTLAAVREGTPNDGLTADDMFRFETGPLTVEFPLDGIAELDSVIMLDDENGVTFTGFNADDIDFCPRGPVVGAWVRVDGDSLNGGFFRAKWMGAHGNVTGHVRGRWGVLEDGRRLLAGKIIDPRGRYLGHVRGTWNHHENDPGTGDIRATWVARRPDGNHRHMGFMHGHWTVSDRIPEGGLFRGIWGHACAAPDDGGGNGDDTGDGV